MESLTDFITQYRWVDIFTVWFVLFVLVDDAHAVLHSHFGEWRTRGPKPVFTDSEVIAIPLTGLWAAPPYLCVPTREPKRTALSGRPANLESCTLE